MKHEELISGLKKLHLPQISREYIEISKLAEKEKKTYEQYLATLVHLEIVDKNRLKVERLVKQAQIPIKKRLENFNFDVRDGITAKEVNRLCTGEFIRQAGNVVFFGDFGVGKSHLAATLTEKLCEAGFKCLFLSTHGLIAQLVAAKRDLTLVSLFKKLDKFDLITCDELGYVPHDQEGADLFFQLISQRYERKSLLITTNLTYSEWGEVFINLRTTKAAVDRVIHNCETFNITGPSWREKTAKEKLKNLATSPAISTTTDAPTAS
jgi:DNA replication protein DnaC